MKTKLTKIISMLIAAAIVLGTGFTAMPKPTSSPDSPVVIIEIDSDSNDGKNNEGANEAKPQIDESPDEIDQ